MLSYPMKTAAEAITTTRSEVLSSSELKTTDRTWSKSRFPSFHSHLLQESLREEGMHECAENKALTDESDAL